MIRIGRPNDIFSRDFCRLVSIAWAFMCVCVCVHNFCVGTLYVKHRDFPPAESIAQWLLLYRILVSQFAVCVCWFGDLSGEYENIFCFASWFTITVANTRKRGRKFGASVIFGWWKAQNRRDRIKNDLFCVLCFEFITVDSLVFIINFKIV